MHFMYVSLAGLIRGSLYNIRLKKKISKKKKKIYENTSRRIFSFRLTFFINLTVTYQKLIQKKNGFYKFLMFYFFSLFYLKCLPQSEKKCLGSWKKK